MAAARADHRAAQTFGADIAEAAGRKEAALAHVQSLHAGAVGSREPDQSHFEARAPT